MAACTGNRSRKRLLDCVQQQDQRQEPAAKKVKTDAGRPYPPRFWDTLSKVRLTRQALKELDGRSKQTLLSRLAETRGPLPARRMLRSDYRRFKESASKGGPDLSTIRGYSYLRAGNGSVGESSSQGRKRSVDSRSSRTDATGRTKTTTPYSGEFEQKLIDNGVYPKGYCLEHEGRPQQPGNIKAIRAMLSIPRPSLSPSKFSDTAFEDFQEMNDRANAESKAIAEVIPVIVGAKDKQHESIGDLRFNRLKKFDPDLSTPKPDKYYGAKPAQIDPRVRRDLSKYIVPSSRTNLPILPNFFLEGKSAKGNPAVAQRRAMLNGGIGARGMLQTQNYGNRVPTYDGNAYTISSAYHLGTGTLEMYSTHPRQSQSGDRTDYHMTQLNSYAMTGNINGFRDGAAAYRNARDWTKERRDQFIADANAVVQGRRSVTISAETQNRATISRHDEDDSSSETSPDELEASFDSNKRQRSRRN